MPAAQSCLRLFETPRTVVHQAPLSMEFSSQEYWSQLPFLTPGDRPKPGIEPMSLESPALAGIFFTTVPRGKLYHDKSQDTVIVYVPSYKALTHT